MSIKLFKDYHNEVEYQFIENNLSFQVKNFLILALNSFIIPAVIIVYNKWGLSD